MKRTIICCLLLCAFSAAAADFAGIEAMLMRRASTLHGKVIFKDYAANTNNAAKDAFRLYKHNNKLVIEATSQSAAAAGINHYLKHYCHSSISHAASSMHIAPQPPLPQDTISVYTPFERRYALNYCTYNYTYSFYTWQDWEWELDWMALNGINLMLAPIGTEIVWQRTLSQFGFRDEEIKRFLPGPAYTAWWLMGNLEGWGGPITDAMIEYAKTMQQKILQRMRELGITPIMQGFWGMIPISMKEKYPHAKIMPQGTWAGGFPRPSLLLPQDSMFGKMAAVYYGFMQEYYGAASYWGGDLFHEGGSTQGIDVGMTGRFVQENMLKHTPNATWALQGWGGNPKDALLAGLQKEHAIVIDLFGESQQNWRKRSEYDGCSWLWCSVNNFGGKVGMGAQLPTLVQEPHRALAFSRKNAANNTHNTANNPQNMPNPTNTAPLLKGIGIIPEGIDANPIAYDFALQTAWLFNSSHNTKHMPNAKHGRQQMPHAASVAADTALDMPNVEDYLRQYIWYRYGAWHDSIYAAWRILLSTAYGDYAHKGEGTYESILCARPAMQISSVSTWGPRKMQYPPQPLHHALQLMRHAAPLYAMSQTYQYDLTDLARQCLANYARTIYQDIIAAFNAKDMAQLQSKSKVFLSIILRQDSLLATNYNFMLAKWLEQAHHYCSDIEHEAHNAGQGQHRAAAADASICMRNARTLVSYWGPDNAKTDLHDYSHREWSGLLSTLYMQRWRAFLEDLQHQLHGHAPAAIDYYGMERAWSLQTNPIPAAPANNYLTQVDKVIGMLRATTN